MLERHQVVDGDDVWDAWPCGDEVDRRRVQNVGANPSRIAREEDVFEQLRYARRSGRAAQLTKRYDVAIARRKRVQQRARIAADAALGKFWPLEHARIEGDPHQPTFAIAGERARVILVASRPLRGAYAEEASPAAPRQRFAERVGDARCDDVGVEAAGVLTGAVCHRRGARQQLS
jgi:hypothetical protein